MVHHVYEDLPDWIQASVVIGVPEGINLPSDLRGSPPFISYISKTIGQADTVYQLVDCCKPDDHILILDCDMVIPSEDIVRMISFLELYDAVIAVMETFDPNASRVDSVPFPTRFVEKEPISQWGIVGARAFNNAGQLAKALERTLQRYATLHREPYLSVAINEYPGKKYAHIITEFQDFGTPERVKASGAEIVCA